jgi:hypothetical protein
MSRFILQRQPRPSGLDLVWPERPKPDQLPPELGDDRRVTAWNAATLRQGLQHQASFDPGRPWKSKALILDVGRKVRPFITPDDPDAVRVVIESHR